jgi:UDP-N-acetylmuramoyl-tripeptide--D-alanyl-D-alanine ligase
MTMSIAELYGVFRKSNGVSIDTRSIEEGNLFFAIKGPNFDGHKYIHSALESGASFVIADNSDYDFLDNVFVVNNTIETLQNLARYHRCMMQIPVIGITGSNGKTTTKELVTSVLRTKFSVFATKGNYNNHLGVPLSVLSIKDHHEIAIIEMGANRGGEIRFLSEIAMPTIGIITNIGKAHLEGFGGLEGVRKGKTELYDYLKATNGIIFYNIDDDIIKESLPSETTNLSYSISNVHLESSYPYVDFKFKNLIIHSKLIGTYNLVNMLVALSIGEYFGLGKEDLKNGVENYIPNSNRSEVKETQYNTLIMDAYNANPTSMVESIKNFNSHPSKKKTLIIGHMLELGESSEIEHRNLIEFIDLFEWDNVFLVGSEFLNLGLTIPYEVFRSTEELSKKLDRYNIKGHTILLKGSRGVALEKCLDQL